jgi:hypothetical protein
MTELDSRIERLLVNEVKGKKPSDSVQQRVFERLETKKWHRSRRRPIFYMLAILMMFASIPAFASSFHIKLGGFDYSIKEEQDHNLYFSSLETGYMATKQRAVQMFDSIAESQSNFPFQIMRPNETILPLKESKGMVETIMGYPPEGHEYLHTFWDIYQTENKRVYVVQQLNMWQVEVDDNLDNTFTYPSYYKPLDFGANYAAFYADFGKQGKEIQLRYKNNSGQIIWISLQGNVSKEELINIAKSYN